MKTTVNTDYMILCGGQGTRLRSVIGESQKVMASVGEEPFLDLLIKYIHSEGARRIVLLTGFKAGDVEKHVVDRFKDMTIESSREDIPLGTGGAIKNALKLIQSDEFFVLNGDSFCPVDFKKFLDFHRGKNALASVVVCPVVDASDYGSIVLKEDMRIAQFQEKISSQTTAYVNAGVYCFSRRIVERMPTLDKFSLEKDFFPLMTQEAFYGFVVDSPFMDIGTPERFKKARDWFIEHGLIKE